jgi:hypothetical protein
MPTRWTPNDRRYGTGIEKIISRALIPDGMRPSTLRLVYVRNEITQGTIQTFSVFDSKINRANSPRQGNAILR